MREQAIAMADSPCEIDRAELAIAYQADGTIHLRSNRELGPQSRSLAHILDETAARWPDRPFLLQRSPAATGWQSISYAAAAAQTRAIAQWLLDSGYRPGDVVAIVSKPSIEHGLVALALQRVRMAGAPISPAYALATADFGKLIDCFERTGATLAFVDDLAAFADAARALAPLGIRFLAARGAPDIDHTSLAEALATPVTAAVADEMEQITPDTVARIMHTSGSTGTPKAAPLTQANLTLTIAQCEAMGLLDLGDDQPQFLESMPFNHIMGGNYNFGNMIRIGAALHLDEGKPTPALFAETLANLHTVSPHVFHTVPAGFMLLCDALEADVALRKRFYRNLVYFGCGGAVLPGDVKARLDTLSVEMTGRVIPIYGFYGATEYSLGAVRYWPGPMEVIGIPPPATALKLVPVGPKYELRIRSAALMPRSGYLGDPAASAALFDADGYFLTRDAMRFHDPKRPHLGLVFDGRIAEEFKLLTGTWVSVGSLCADLLSDLDGLIDEAVICGLNEPHVGALLWLNERAARRIGGDHSLAALARSPEVAAAVDAGLAAFNRRNPGSSRRIVTARIMAAPLSAQSGELTDKGSVNQRRVRELRHDDVAALFAPDSDVLRPCGATGE